MTTAVTDTHKAFRLEQSHADQGFSGGSIAGPLGETIDLLALLDDTSHGNVQGVIVTSDPSVIGSLHGLPMFEETDLPGSYEPPVEPGDEPLPDDLDSLRKQQLVDLAADRGLDTSGTIADLVDRVRAYEGERAAAATPVLVGWESVEAQYQTPGALRQDGTVTGSGQDSPEPAAPPEPDAAPAWPEPSTDTEGAV